MRVHREEALNRELTLHDGVVLGHPGGDDGVLAEAVNVGKGADTLVDLVPVTEKKSFE